MLGTKGDTRFKEATNINTSLLAMGNVVQALAKQQAHVPFRDSNLTRVLEGSLGGLCRTSLLVCVAPEMYHATETQSTLEFAARAIAIVAKPVVFQVETLNTRCPCPPRQCCGSIRFGADHCTLHVCT